MKLGAPQDLFKEKEGVSRALMWKGKKKSLFGPLELENFHFDVVNPQLSHAVTRHQRPK